MSDAALRRNSTNQAQSVPNTTLDIKTEIELAAIRAILNTLPLEKQSEYKRQYTEYFSQSANAIRQANAGTTAVLKGAVLEQVESAAEQLIRTTCEAIKAEMSPENLSSMDRETAARKEWAENTRFSEMLNPPAKPRQPVTDLFNKAVLLYLHAGDSFQE
jgi:hypothetical protein